MKTETTRVLSMTRTIKANPEKVFEALTQPRHLREWSCPEGGTVTKAEVDLRVGGAFNIVMDEGEGGVHSARGVYKEIDPPSRLVYTWDWDDPEYAMGDTLITIELRPTDAGSTEVTFVHDLFPSEEAKAEHEKGWMSCLNRLEALFT